MTKLIFAILASIIVSTSAFAQNVDIRYRDGNTAVGVHTGPQYAGARYGSGGRTCPKGETPTKLGCMGETITDRELLREFDQRIEGGCVQGQTRVIWKNGTDSDGKPVRWQIKQHSECGSRS